MERMLPRMALLGLLWALNVASAAAQTVNDDPWSSTEIAAPRMDSRPLSRGPAPKEPPAAAAPSHSNSWVRTTAALAGVVALIVLLGWGYRLMANGTGRLGWSLRGRHPALIEVVSRAALSPRQSLCLVRIGPRLVLLGVTADAVRPLDVIHDAELTARLIGQAAQQRPDSHSAEFARTLEHEASTYAAPESSRDTLTPDAQRIIAIKERLADTLQRLRAKAAS